MIDKKEIAKRINVSLATIYNWEKTKPELIKMIENSYKYEKGESEAEKFLEYFYELSIEKQELYKTKIKLEALEKRQEKKNNK
ncbi:helix-turn-helix domain-containing protein [Campylobacter sputorum]|uniref:TetR/AcrR family transcriptional regulator n=1 Tax=Campylobacter sputorum TaxID=206 RepID=UPI001E5864E7|nr:TetR/AcrR family transcriptional regulator [Campylobacter sputorum]